MTAPDEKDVERLAMANHAFGCITGDAQDVADCVARWDAARLATAEARIAKLEAVANRLCVEIEPCARCAFARATHGRYNAAFGVGAPRLCATCATDEDVGDDWRPAPAIRPAVREALAALDTSGMEKNVRTECTCPGLWDPLRPFAHCKSCTLASLPSCRGCNKKLLPENEPVADGCPCNSPRGINHGVVRRDVCTCVECDPAQTGSSRVRNRP